MVQSHLQAQNQEKITNDFTIYTVKLLLHNQEKVKGALFQVTDSTITISNSMSIDDYKIGNYTTTEYPINQIKWVKAYRRTRKVLASGMVGLLVGGAIGYKIGSARKSLIRNRRYLIKRNHPTKGLFIGSVIGATVGVLIGRNGVSRMSNSRAKTIRKLKRRAIKKG